MGWERARQRSEEERRRERRGAGPRDCGLRPTRVRSPGGAERVVAGQPETLPESEAAALSERLYESGVAEEVRRGVIVFLAEHRSERAVSALQRFAEVGPGPLRELARRELERSQGPQSARAPCPCGSGSRAKDCCAWRLP